MGSAAETNSIDLENASFEEVVGRLEGVVERLEEGDLPLEESLSVFEEGVRLSRAGAERLDAAERRVELLLSKRDGSGGDDVKTSPLDDKEPGSS